MRRIEIGSRSQLKRGASSSSVTARSLAAAMRSDATGAFCVARWTLQHRRRGLTPPPRRLLHRRTAQQPWRNVWMRQTTLVRQWR